MVWCMDRANTDSPDPWAAALHGHARLFQGALVSRLMKEGRINAWETVKVTYDKPDTAPSQVGVRYP